jgi:hypothetical protein
MQEPIVTFPQSPMQSPRNQKSMIRQSQDILDDSREIANIYEHQWRHPRHPNCLSCNNGCLVKHNANSTDRFTMFCTNPACHLFFENNSSYFGPKTPLPPPDTSSKIQTFIILIAVVVFLGVFLSGIMNSLFGRH